MKILFLDGFTDEKERSIYTELVYFNVMKNMKTLVTQAQIFEYNISSENTVNLFSSLSCHFIPSFFWFDRKQQKNWRIWPFSWVMWSLQQKEEQESKDFGRMKQLKRPTKEQMSTNLTTVVHSLYFLINSPFNFSFHQIFISLKKQFLWQHWSYSHLWISSNCWWHSQCESKDYGDNGNSVWNWKGFEESRPHCEDGGCGGTEKWTQKVDSLFPRSYCHHFRCCCFRVQSSSGGRSHNK